MVVTLDTGSVSVAGKSVWIAPMWFWQRFSVVFGAGGQSFVVSP
jgi:hypothetical protein